LENFDDDDDDDDDDVDIISAWENMKENIRALATESLGYHELKQHNYREISLLPTTHKILPTFFPYVDSILR
jgi:hypothetical protein